MDYTERRARELLRLPCDGYMEYTMDGNEFSCGYGSGCICEDCICNFHNCGGYIDPRTDKPVSEKIRAKMKEISERPEPEPSIPQESKYLCLDTESI